jgi:hypothetical protein
MPTWAAASAADHEQRYAQVTLFRNP